jgi:hypothetical protein
MKKLSLILSIVMMFTNFPIFADQVWGDAVEVIGSNHDQFIEITITAGETWETGLDVYIKESGQAVVFPVSGIVQYNPQIQVSKSTWNVNSYDTPDNITASKLEPSAGVFNYDVVFSAATDLEALSKSFDKISIKVNVLELETPIDTTPPSISAPSDLIKEATAVLTPVDLGLPQVDDENAVVTNDSPNEFEIGTTIVEWKAVDPSGNVGSDLQQVTITDTTPPVFTSLPSNKMRIYSGKQTLVELGLPEVFDIFPVILSNNAPEDGFPLGTTVVTWKATDSNGNITLVEQQIIIRYQFSGFLQPINNDGSSIFKLGSTVPVKFKLTDSSGNIVPDAIASIYTSKLTDQIIGSITEATSTSSATTGNLFRFDSVEQQYIFNLSTKNMSKGTHNIIVNLNDGSTQTVMISLK